ncbi:hypothetical protein DSM19430T_09020 [Desulfovibrio psychrotolerans]|uniref:Uncharacterized protein n=1 Tax=Desulfovibrio psychrotolerans TaxID=415242 RepID=A0A7J0BRD0_9BACT|nr:hypothetical protein DSM19430T_09020 [Desulfovibrio psychrotolerans]
MFIPHSGMLRKKQCPLFKQRGHGPHRKLPPHSLLPQKKLFFFHIKQILQIRQIHTGRHLVRQQFYTPDIPLHILLTEVVAAAAHGQGALPGCRIIQHKRAEQNGLLLAVPLLHRTNAEIRVPFGRAGQVVDEGVRHIGQVLMRQVAHSLLVGRAYMAEKTGVLPAYVRRE